jgi:hypothetical protein
MVVVVVEDQNTLARVEGKENRVDKLLDLIILKEESIILLQQEQRESSQLVAQQQVTSAVSSIALSLDMSLSLSSNDHRETMNIYHETKFSACSARRGPSHENAGSR